MNHHQGSISCLAKTTVVILLCSLLMTWSMLWRHTSLLCKRAVHGTVRYTMYRTLAQQASIITLCDSIQLAMFVVLFYMWPDTLME
jgi:hypothetical protein